MKKLDDILAYCEKATPGPWWNGYDRGTGSFVARSQAVPWEQSVVGQYFSTDEDALFSAKARTDLPLVAECLKEALAALEHHELMAGLRKPPLMTNMSLAILAKLEGKKK